MKSISNVVLAFALTAGIVSGSLAADEKKNDPSKSEVEDILEEIGGDHLPERMKINELGSVETDKTYYHIFYGSLKKGGYHLIFFDNTPAYLGYYVITLEPSDYGEGEIYLRQGSGAPVTIPIGDEGPTDKLRIGSTGMTAKFIPAPVKEEPVVEETTDGASSTAATSTSAPPKEPKKPEYRPWTITMGGTVVNVESAIFVEMKDGKVTIKNAKNGKLATVKASALSDADKEYLRDLLQ